MGVQACIPRGVQRGVQKWLFVRGSCGARNPMVAALFCLPATMVKARKTQSLPFVVVAAPVASSVGLWAVRLD